MKKLLILTGIVGATILTAQTTFAFQGDRGDRQDCHNPDRQAAIAEVFDTANYEGWVDVMEGRRMVDRVTSERFIDFLSARKDALASGAERYHIGDWFRETYPSEMGNRQQQGGNKTGEGRGSGGGRGGRRGSGEGRGRQQQ